MKSARSDIVSTAKWGLDVVWHLRLSVDHDLDSETLRDNFKVYWLAFYEELMHMLCMNEYKASDLTVSKDISTFFDILKSILGDSIR